MKFFYLNDEQKPIRVRIMDSRFDPVSFTGDFHITLQPCEGKIFEVLLPEGHVLWVKKWKDAVMFSTCEAQNLAGLGEVFPPQQLHQQPPEDSL